MYFNPILFLDANQPEATFDSLLEDQNIEDSTNELDFLSDSDDENSSSAVQTFELNSHTNEAIKAAYRQQKFSEYDTNQHHCDISFTPAYLRNQVNPQTLEFDNNSGVSFSDETCDLMGLPPLFPEYSFLDDTRSTIETHDGNRFDDCNNRQTSSTQISNEKESSTKKSILIRWRASSIPNLVNLYDQYLLSHASPEGEQGISHEGWELLVKDLGKKISDIEFTIIGCQIACSRYCSKNRVEQNLQITTPNETIGLACIEKEVSDVPLVQEISKKRHTGKWTPAYKIRLQELFNEYIETHPRKGKRSLNKAAWVFIADQMQKEFQERKFTFSSCRDAYGRLSQTTQLNLSVEPNQNSISDISAVQKSHKGRKKVKWTPDHKSRLYKLYNKYIATHPSGKKGDRLSKTGWELIVKKIEKKFPTDKFTITSCQTAYSLYFSKKPVEQDPEKPIEHIQPPRKSRKEKSSNKQLVKKSNTTIHLFKWTKPSITYLNIVYDQYRKSHPSPNGEHGISEEGWILLVTDMQKKYPNGNFTLSSCQTASFRYCRKE